MQVRIYSSYLFKDFLKCHKKFFTFSNNERGLKHSYFNFENEKYQSFVVQFLSHLEPIELNKGQIIFNELENVDMIIFMSGASIDLGYDINRQTKFV